MAYDVDRIRMNFPALQRELNGRPIIFFDNPAGTQVPRSVVERMNEAMFHKNANLGGVRRQNIWRNSRRRLAECRPRLGVDVRRRACGVASADVRWSVA